MNSKEKTLNQILDIVVEESTYSFSPIRREDVIGRENNTQNVCRTRSIFVSMCMLLQYTKETIAAFLDNRSIQAVDDMLYKAYELKRASDWTYLESSNHSEARILDLRRQLIAK